jgi:GNAT superfamily N-acetyltransferase
LIPVELKHARTLSRHLINQFHPSPKEAHVSVIFHSYNHAADYPRVDQFLLDHFQPGNADQNWIEPAWEYANFHPNLDPKTLEKIGLWEESGKIVAIAQTENQFGEAFFQISPGYHHLQSEMLDYAEQALAGWSVQENRTYLLAYANNDDIDFQDILSGRGYTREKDMNRPMSRFEIPDPFPPIALPEGFQLKSLADECDWARVNRVMWRGFNHEGEPPTGKEELESRRRMFETPNGRHELKIVVVAPNGDFASFCGMFYVPTKQYAYVEPVATDPTYRRLGLGKAAVLEGLRRCGTLGAREGFVGSDQDFYFAVGFHLIYTSECWVKYF